MVLGGHHADLQPAPVGGHRVQAQSAGGRVAAGGVGAHSAQPPGAGDQVLSLEQTWDIAHFALYSCCYTLLVGYDPFIDLYLVNVILQRQVRHQARQPLAVLHHNFLLSSVCCEYHCTVVMCFNNDRHCLLTFGFVLMQTTEQAALSTIITDSP